LAIAPPITTVSACSRLEKRLEQADLVADLGAAENDDEGTPTDVAQFSQRFELSLYQKTGDRGPQMVGHPGHGRVRPVHASERVVDEEIPEPRQAGAKVGIVRRLAGQESSVLEKKHRIAVEIFTGPERLLGIGRPDEPDRQAEMCLERRRHRREGKTRSDPALRPSQV
jgi:hypothetical protein